MKHNLVNPVIKENYIKTLLQYRGVEKVEEFLNPKMTDIQSPEALDNIEAGARLFFDNIDKKILLIVDCDVDGFTSAAIIYLYIKKINPEADITYLIHSKKQHGLEDHIETIENSNIHYDLAILPDSSSNDKQYHNRLKELNTQVLVLDHHILETEISDNAIVINNQASNNYKNKELTGAGVAWQFCRYCDQL